MNNCLRNVATYRSGCVPTLSGNDRFASATTTAAKLPEADLACASSNNLIKTSQISSPRQFNPRPRWPTMPMSTYREPSY